MTRRIKAEDEAARLDPADRALIEMLRTQLDPGESTPAEQAAFRARLEARLAEQRAVRGFLRPRPPVLAVSVALVMAALWVARPFPSPEPDGAEPAFRESSSPRLLSYAYYETDYLAVGQATELEAGSGVLSDEFRAIAAAFEID